MPGLRGNGAKMNVAKSCSLNRLGRVHSVGDLIYRPGEVDHEAGNEIPENSDYFKNWQLEQEKKKQFDGPRMWDQEFQSWAYWNSFTGEYDAATAEDAAAGKSSAKRSLGNKQHPFESTFGRAGANSMFWNLAMLAAAAGIGMLIFRRRN